MEDLHCVNLLWQGATSELNTEMSIILRVCISTVATFHGTENLVFNKPTTSSRISCFAHYPRPSWLSSDWTPSTAHLRIPSKSSTRTGLIRLSSSKTEPGIHMRQELLGRKFKSPARQFSNRFPVISSPMIECPISRDGLFQMLRILLDLGRLSGRLGDTRWRTNEDPRPRR